MPAGHAKSACALVTKIVRLGRVHATILTPESFYDRIKTEVARNFVPGKEDDLRDLIRSEFRAQIFDLHNSAAFLYNR